MGEGNMDELQLPAAPVINKCVKEGIPDGTVISKDAKQAFVTAATVSILYVLDSANLICREKRRSTVMPDNVKEAVERDFPQLYPMIQKYAEDLQNEKAEKNMGVVKSVAEDA